MLLDIVVKVLLSGLTGPRLWIQWLRLILRIGYHSLLAIFNPADTLGEDHGSVSLLTGSFRSATLTISRPITVGPLTIVSLSTKVSIGVSFGWSGNVAVTLEHLHCQIEVNSYAGMSDHNQIHSSVRKERNTKQIDMLVKLMEVLRRYKVMVLPIIKLTIKDVQFGVNEELSLHAESLLGSVAINPRNSGVELGCGVKGLNLRAQQQEQGIPLLQLTSADAKLEAWADVGRGNTLTVDVEDCFLGTTSYNRSALVSTLVQYLNMTAPPVQSYNHQSFDALMQRFAEIDQEVAALRRRAEQTGRSVQACAADDAAQLEGLDDAYSDAREENATTRLHGAVDSKHPMDVVLRVRRVGVVMDAGSTRYPVQVLCACDCAIALTQRKEGDSGALSSSGADTRVTNVQRLHASVGSLQTCRTTAEHCVDGRFLTNLESAMDVSVAPVHPEVEGGANQSDAEKWLSLRYDVTASAQDREQRSYIYKSTVSCAIAATHLPICVPAVSVALGMVAEASAPLQALGRLKLVDKLRAGREIEKPRGVSTAKVVLKRVEVSAPSIRIGLIAPRLSPETFTRRAGDTRGGPEAAMGAMEEEELLSLSFRQLALTGFPPTLERTASSGDVCSVQQFFLTAAEICVGRSFGHDGDQAEICRVSEVSITKIVRTSVSGRGASDEEGPALSSAVQLEAWAARELEHCAQQDRSYSSETTAQVSAVSIAASQHDLHVIGVVSGLLSTGARLFRPLQHFHPSPVCVINTADRAPGKLYVVLLSVSVDLRWEHEHPEAPTEDVPACPVILYRILTDAYLSYSSQFLGTLYSKASLHGPSDLVVSRVCAGVRGEAERVVEILRIRSAAEEEASPQDTFLLSAAAACGLSLNALSNRRMCLFTSKSMPSECHRGASALSVGVRASYVNVVLPVVLASLDYTQLNALCLLLRAHRVGGRLAEQALLQHCGGASALPEETPIAQSNPHLLQLASPSSITAVHVESMKINLFHELHPVMTLCAKKVDVHRINFGPAVSQLVVVAHSLQLFELTAKYAVHTCILGDIDAHTPNRMEMHISSKAGECSLCELQFEQVRVFYLQRSIMTLISYLRDHIISSIYAGLSSATALAGCTLTVPVWAPELPASRGMFRLGVIFQKSELHLPLNSCSTDALVVIIDNTYAFRSFPAAVATPLSAAYCKGPFLLRKQWVSEIKNSRRLMYQLFVGKTDAAAASSSESAATLTAEPGAGSTSALSQLFAPVEASTATAAGGTAPVPAPSSSSAAIKWNFPLVAEEIFTPAPGIEFNTYPEFCLELAVVNSCICSWCDANAVASDISLTGKYALIPITPGPAGEIRNRVWVDVVAEEVDWVLSQGQYLAIINLIQQNFCELSEVVPDIYPLPPPKTVELYEDVYGKYGLDSQLPILSTVPIHIRRGKITAVESLPEYFDLFCTPLPAPHFPYGPGGHNIPPSTSGAAPQNEFQFRDTIPAYSKHVPHRNRVFARMASNSASGAGKSASASKSKSRSSRQQSEAESGESIIKILFERLEIDFFRLHEGGGNGIEVSAGTFVIVGIEDHPSEDDDVASVHSESLDELSLDSIIFAPRCLPILNSGSNRNAFSTTKSTSPRKKGGGAASGGKRGSASSAVEAQASVEDEPEALTPVPHITYSQQGTQNLRRCVVTITDSMAVANIAKVLHTVEYFLKPVHVNTHRNLYCIAASRLGPYDFKIGLDMEVHVNNTVVCLTNISRRDGASALIFHVNLDYTQAWRGFLSSGPGKIGMNIDISVMNIYIAPMREINSNSIQSLVDPCVLVVGQDMMIHPPERTMQRNLDLITPWMTLGKWALKVNKTDLPSTTRIVKFKVAPARTSTAGSSESGALSEPVTPAARPKASSTDESSTKSPTVEDGSPRPDRADDDDDDEEYPDRAPRTGEAYYSGEESSTPTVRIQISTKDIHFIATAVKQARVALNKRLVITANQPDFFHESKSMLQDIAHLPQLTYYLEHTALDTPSRKNKNNELLAEICDFEAILRNNTYNLNILRMNVFDNCMLYTRSPEQLHMASGSAFAMWAYNEATDLWEPLVEPINVRAIGATDESIQAAGMQGTGPDGAPRSGAKIRIEVVTDPLELNAPQTALGHLIRKLSLADVVTTSSIHLPPYKVINELGVDVKFAIGMGDSIITEKDIESGKSLPVEVQQLAEALEAFKLRRNYSSKVDHEFSGHKEYVMGITFPNFRDVYSSRVPLPIDKVGVHTYDMFNTGQKTADAADAVEVQFDRRRISMGSMGSQKVGAMTAIAQAAAAAARSRASSNVDAGGIAAMGEGLDDESADEGNNSNSLGSAPSSAALARSASKSRDALSEDSTSVPVETDLASNLAAPGSAEGSPRTPVKRSHASSVSSSISDMQPSPARPALFRRNSLTGTSAPEGTKFVQEVPLAVMEMRIKADGVREILLRSILSFKNNTSRVFQISVRLYGSSVETSLAPGKEWFVPVRFVNPKASLFIRLDERSNWFEALSSMQSLIVQGYWGDPTRLRAHLCACPSETSEVRDGSNGWILLIKPEVKDLKAQMQGSTAKCFIPVRYPTKDAFAKSLKEGINATELNNAGQASSSGGPTLKSRGAKAQPMCIQLLAPLQLCNLIPQPLLYRLADAEGLITSEGILLPGEMVDVHSIFKLFVSRIFISVRMLNYCWSKWTLVFSRTNPFSSTEHLTDLTLSSMNLMYLNRELTLPSVDISMVTREYLIRFSCSVLISNRTGLLLDLCEPSASDSYVPHASRTAAEAFLQVLAHHGHHHHHHKQHPQLPEGGATPALRERPSFRHGNRLRTVSSEMVLGVRTRRTRDRAAGEDEEEAGADEEDESESDDSESGKESGDDDLSESRGSFSLNDLADFESDAEVDAKGEGVDDVGIAGRQKADAEGMARFSLPRQSTQQVGGSPGRNRLSTRALPNLPNSPFSPYSAPPDSLGGTSFATPGTGTTPLLPGAAAARSDKIVNLIVHLPFDHLRQVEVVASSDWTLQDVFARVKQRLATSLTHQTAGSYVFFSWENGKLGPRKVDNSLIIEAQMQYDNAEDGPQQAGKAGGGDGVGGSATAASSAPVAPAPRERPVSMFSRERSVTTASNSSTAGRKAPQDSEVPATMQFEMLADCAAAPLAMSAKVDGLQCTRLRLCHVMEWEIYKQIKAIKTEVVEKEGLFSSMFGRARCTHHAPLIPFEGDIPFKPHRLMGFKSTLSLRVPSASTDWSDAVDVIRGDFDSSELCIVATSTPTPVSGGVAGTRTSTRSNPPLPVASQVSSSAPPVFYEFGAFLERGRGFLHNVTTVTLVPKHMLISKLSFPIQVRQIFPSGECEPLLLQPGTLCSYHFPSRSKSKLLQIRRAAAPIADPTAASGTAPTDTTVASPSWAQAGEWLAELDICKIGVLYAKLRDPVQIIKVQIDCVGASMVATLTEQSTLWPPYRIDNMTAMEVRFRQVVVPEKAATGSGASANASNKRGTAAQLVGKPLEPIPEMGSTAADGTAGSSKPTADSQVSGGVQLPWDHLERGNTAPYAWDLPFSGKKAIQLEVRQLSTSWVPCEVCLDDDDKPAPVLVKKAAPSLGNPFAEGYLLRQDATGDGWTRVYCILRPDVLYIYPDESRDYLIQVINLSALRATDNVPQFAHVSRYMDKRWTGTIGYISSVMGSSAAAAAAKSKAIDINKTRCMMLKIAESLGMLANLSDRSFAKARDSEDGSEAGSPTKSLEEAASPRQPTEEIAIVDVVESSASTTRVTFGGIIEAVDAEERPSADRRAISSESAGSEPDWAELMADRDTFSNMPGESPGKAAIAAPIVSEEDPGTTATETEGVKEEPPETEAEARESVASVRRARFSSAPGASLATLLAAKVSMDDLLEEASAVPIRVSEVIDALLATKMVDRVERAREMCEWMLTEGLLMPKAASRAFDGSVMDLDLTDAELAETAAAAAATAAGTDVADEPPVDSDEDPDELADTFPAADGRGRAAPVNPRSSLSSQTMRQSMSRQFSRAHSEDPPQEGGSRKSIVNMVRRKPTLLKLYEDADLYMCPPSLNPEMLAMMERMNEAEEEGQLAGSAGASNPGGAESETFGFTIMMDTAKYNFKCSSEMEFFGWIQACRQSIELLWVDHLLGRRADKKAVSLEDYQATILLRLRADGSTKVLEIMQDDENITKEARQKSKSRIRGGRRATVSSAEALSKLSRVIRNSHLAPSLLADSEVKEFNREKELISVLFTVQSVALSVINAEPSELLYLSLHGIEMTVERSIDLVKFSGTVQEIQLSNQLLDPEFSVALFPRRMREGQGGRLMLPGLNQSRTTFPSLHIYIQQRYHQSISDVGNPAAADSFEEDSNLHYFEMFTLWISPMKLDVDEEIIVKCIRYVRGLKDVVYNPNMGRGAEMKEDLLNVQQLGSKSWEGHADRKAVFELYVRLLEAGKVPYQTYSPSAKSSTGIYLSLLQLHPIDLVMSFRPSPNLVVTNSELAMISIISQLDSARLCLNALIAEHAFGSPAILGGVLVKHYKAAFWKQFHRLIGSADIVEGSVGLVANLGSGVYDLFYEPIDGLLDENGSFLTGLSKGGISLASRTIGGTSAFTSQITGGLGKGVSLLTLDSQFQRNRAYRRFNKTSTVSEGLYVGTQELGKNIVEGVTGIVVSPYRGWETGGGVGFGMGIAKGILGVALKPAVGVFDLASRATEGLRNTAFSENQGMLEERCGVYRKRIPRAFGRNGQIALYDAKAAAAQYVADSVTAFQPDPRLQVVHHLYIRRKLEKFINPALLLEKPVVEEDVVEVAPSEAWGFPLGRTYVVLVGSNRIVLAELSTPDKTAGTKKVPKKKILKPRKFVWSCPASCIDQLFSDPNGDLILSIGNSALISGTWNNTCPVVLDNHAQNYVIFQSLLEQTIGHKRARYQPLNPVDGMIQADIRKRYSSGIKSYLLSPSNHTYRLHGHVLYEYSDTAAKKAAAKLEAGAPVSAADAAEGAEKAAAAQTEAAETAAAKSEYFIDQMIARIFPTAETASVTPTAAAKAGAPAEPCLDDMYLSFVYPLADLYITNPTPEDGGKFYSITLTRLDGQKMRVLKSEEEQEHFSEYLKNSLSLIFARHEDAAAWKHALEEQMLWNLEEDELVPPGPLTTEDRRKQGRTIMAMARGGGEEVVQPVDHSILGMLVLPTSGCKAEQTETIKIEIAKTLSATRWR